MKSEGWARCCCTPWSCYAGFDHVVCSSTAAKLASGGDICDANMVCVFDKSVSRRTGRRYQDCLARSYSGRSDPSRLYPLTHFSVSGEEGKQEGGDCGSAVGGQGWQCKLSFRRSPIKMKWGDFPEVISAALGHTLCKEDSSCKIGGHRRSRR